jgi:hypothetical protein
MDIWDQTDSARFRTYHQQSGGKLLRYLREQVPPLLGTTIESVALEAKHKEGCERIIKTIEAILQDNQQADDSSSGNYSSM